MPPTAIDNLADKLRALGNIPPRRVLWNPLPGTATEKDVLRFVEGEPKRLVELIDGVLVEKASGYADGLLVGWIGTCLNNFVVPRRLGFVGGPAGPMRFSPGLVRLPDVGFISRERLPDPDAHRRAVARFAPDLAVEVLSRGNTRAEIARKWREYFAAGCRLVWVAAPRTSTVAVYTDAEAHTVLTTADTLTGGDVLPGFALPVAELFGYLDLLAPPAR